MIITDTESVEIKTPTGPMRTYIFRSAAEGRYPGLLPDDTTLVTGRRKQVIP